MIRNITREQIIQKMNNGGRILFVEVGPLHSFNEAHLPKAVHLSTDQISIAAESYFPDRGAELYLYGENQFSAEPKKAAWSLVKLGYRNIHLYPGGKQDWFSDGAVSQPAYLPPPEKAPDQSVPKAA